MAGGYLRWGQACARYIASCYGSHSVPVGSQGNLHTRLTVGDLWFALYGGETRTGWAVSIKIFMVLAMLLAVPIIMNLAALSVPVMLWLFKWSAVNAMLCYFQPWNVNVSNWTAVSLNVKDSWLNISEVSCDRRSVMLLLVWVLFIFFPFQVFQGAIHLRCCTRYVINFDLCAECP